MGIGMTIELADTSILIIGAGKSGTSGLYASIKEGLEATLTRSVTGLFEPHNATQIDAQSARPLVAKMLLERFLATDRALLRKFDRRVLIVRDPRDCLVSRLLWQCVGFRGFDTRAKVDEVIDLLRGKEADPQSISLSELYRRIGELGGSTTWLNSATKLSYLPLRLTEDEVASVYRLHYEDFVDGNVEKLDDYLGFSSVHRAIPPKPYNVTFRSATSGDWRRWFTPEDADCFNTKARSKLRSLGYDVMPFEPSSEPLPASKGSEYLLSHFRKRRPELFV